MPGLSLRVCVCMCVLVCVFPAPLRFFVPSSLPIRLCTQTQQGSESKKEKKSIIIYFHPLMKLLFRFSLSPSPFSSLLHGKLLSGSAICRLVTHKVLGTKSIFALLQIPQSLRIKHNCIIKHMTNLNLTENLLSLSPSLSYSLY